ncbi:putative glycosyltransferase [Polaromonas vacuolata]|uniref:Putative glycosyltransferase n=1 Tax=Polaromonas vacuolata TaxID=37448 RepID=A0A6H2H5T1_9BURK|nr:glycosyltransferase family 2 protein [Polaromonas vacuolata]QJC55231.1 putative glycosyltransferase [Polaromonas vacuolata]
MTTLVSLIAPFYNEAAGTKIFFERVAAVFSKLPDYRFEIIAINDGSRDATLDALIDAREHYGYVHIVDFSRNFGKEAALTAGLERASGDAVIPIDTDLQHPPELIIEMLTKWREGAEVVLARRKSRATDGRIQKLSANFFYQIHNLISDIDIPPNVGDFRLLDRKVVVILKQLPESRRFMKGLFAWVGFRSVTIDYDVEPRLQGASSFNFWKLWNFALEGITSFSTAPLRIWTYLGVFSSAIALLYASIIIIKTLVYGVDVPGYASLMVAVLFFGGVQLIGIGVLGEYIGRIYSEVKRRPVYVVRQEHPIDD